jgi:hypothetical protein
MQVRMLRWMTVFAVAFSFAGTTAMQAQTGRLHLGPRASYQFDLEEVGVGAQLGVPIAPYLEFYPSFDIFLVDRGSASDINLDVKYRVGSRATDWMYIGAGVNLARRRGNGDSHTDAGFNAFIGAESLRGSVHPFGEFRFTANNGSTGQISVGLNFTLGDR